MTNTMPAVDADVDRVLTLLRNKIRERGFTQLEVQEMLGWGRSYISQLLTKQKALRLEQVLLILGVVGIDPSDFFGELYPRDPAAAAWRLAPVNGAYAALGADLDAGAGTFSQSFSELRSLVRGLVGLLIDRQLIDVEELSTAVESIDEEQPTE